MYRKLRMLRFKPRQTMRCRSCAVIVVAAIAAASFGAASANASASLTFCNDFPHTVFVALAYLQDSGSWLSRGWLEVHTGECLPFDSAIRVTSFYYRGESEAYQSGGKKVWTSWGDKGRMFATWEDDNFQYYGAENRVLKSSLKGYEQGMDIPQEDYDVTVTFKADGGSGETGRTKSQ